MTRDPADHRWQEVDALFQRVLDLPPGRRSAFLAENTAGDPDLRTAIDALLSSVEQTDDFLESPLRVVEQVDWNDLYAAVTEGDIGADGAGEADRAGERAGPFRLGQRLGRGGMATVYRAERADGLWEQHVAVKIIRRGLDTDDVVRRFRAERQILSSLQHPHVARLLDGGTTQDGLPFLVMELVEGEPITAYCDDNALPVRVRLEMFCKVAHTVQYAHRNLVVHRDLKPSNILVDARGEPMLLDFGIAKVLGADADLDQMTRTGRLLLTPEYASPEQLRGKPITIGSDVYQLGVLLCVLLAGQRPYETGSIGQMLVGTNPDLTPTRPSKLLSDASARARGSSLPRLEKRLRGDLDTIVLKALREQPEDRYATVEAMVADVELYLAGRPIEARPASWGYRSRKLMRRKPWLGPAIAAGLVAIGGYGITLVRHADSLELERNVARSEAERAQEVQEFLIGVFRSTDPYGLADPERGTEITVREALDLGVDRIRSELADRPVLQASLLGTIGDVYTNLGLTGSALPLQEESLALTRGSLGDRSPDIPFRLRVIGKTLLSMNQLDSARVVLSQGLALATELFGTRDTTVVRILLELGRVETRAGRYDEAERLLADATRIALEAEPQLTVLLASTFYELSLVYPELNDPEQARISAEQALEFSRKALGERHPTTAIAMLGLAGSLHSLGDDEGSIQLYRKGIEVLSESFPAGHPNMLSARNNLALRLRDIGDLAGSEAALRELLEIQIEMYGELSSRAGDNLQNLAVTIEGMGRLDEAETLLERARRAYDASLPAGHHLTAFPLLTRSGIQIDRGNFGGAEVSSRQAAEILRAALPVGHYATAVAECRWGRALAGQGHASEGRRLLESAAAAILAAPVTPREYQIECLEALVSLLDPRVNGPRIAEYKAHLAMLTEDPGHGS